MLEESLDHRHVKRPIRLMPVEFILGFRARSLGPQYPCRKDTIEKRLHEGRAEEMLTFFPGKGQTQGLLQCGSQGS
jgi:hypothetical protein